MLFLRQSTASQNVLIGPFVDDTDGTTPETALTIANTDIRLSKNGGNLAPKTLGGATHDEAGWYQITLDATDTNTVGSLQAHVKVVGALMVHAEFHVLEEAIYDALFAAAAKGFDANQRVDVGSWLGTAAATPTAAGVPVVDVTHVAGLTTNVSTMPTNISDILTDTADMQPKIGTPVADVSADIAAVQADTNDIQTRLPAALVGGRMDANASAIAGDATSAARLKQGAKGVLDVVVGTGSTTTTVKLSTVNGVAPSAVNDFYNGAVLVFLTGALAGQRTDITGYVGSTTTATVTALTSAPANGDTAVIV